MWKVNHPPVPGIIGTVLLMSWEGEPTGKGAVWGRKPSSATVHCVWVTYLRLPASHGCDIMAAVYLARERGEERILCSGPHVLSPHVHLLGLHLD